MSLPAFSTSKVFFLFELPGLKQYLEANPSFTSDSPSTYVHSNYCGASIDGADFEDCDLNDEFYDALAKVDSLEDEDSDDDDNDVETKVMSSETILVSIVYICWV